MRRFLIGFTLTLLAVIMAAWAWVVEEPMAFLDYEYPIWDAKLQMVRECRLGEVTIIGDSRATAGLIPARLGAGVVNLALSGASPLENYFLVRRMLACPTPPKAVIASFTLLHFGVLDTFWHRGVKFGIVDYEAEEDVRRRARAIPTDIPFDAPTPGDVDARLKSWLYAHGFPTYYFDSLLGGRLYKRAAENEELFRYVMRTRGQYHFHMGNGSKDLAPETGFDRFDFPLLTGYFESTLALFQERHIPVYFVSIPYNEASRDKIKPEVKQGFADYLNDCARRYPGFHLLGEAMPFLPWTEFGDAGHPNPHGAAIISDNVRKLLNDAHVPGGPFVAEPGSDPDESAKPDVARWRNWLKSLWLR